MWGKKHAVHGVKKNNLRFLAAEHACQDKFHQYSGPRESNGVIPPARDEEHGLHIILILRETHLCVERYAGSYSHTWRNGLMKTPTNSSMTL